MSLRPREGRRVLSCRRGDGGVESRWVLCRRRPEGEVGVQRPQRDGVFLRPLTATPRGRGVRRGSRRCVTGSTSSACSPDRAASGDSRRRRRVTCSIAWSARWLEGTTSRPPPAACRRLVTRGTLVSRCTRAAAVMVVVVVAAVVAVAAAVVAVTAGAAAAAAAAAGAPLTPCRRRHPP